MSKVYYEGSDKYVSANPALANSKSISVGNLAENAADNAIKAAALATNTITSGNWYVATPEPIHFTWTDTSPNSNRNWADSEKKKALATYENSLSYAYLLLPTIEKIIFNPPATIVIWSDGAKTVVKTHNEEFSEEVGLAMAVAKRYFRNRSRFLKECENAKRPQKL